MEVKIEESMAMDVQGNGNLPAEEQNERNLPAAEQNEENAKNAGLMDATDLEALKKKYREIYQIDMVVDEDDENKGRKLCFIFKKPETAPFNRYLKTASKNMATATANFVMDTIIDEHKGILEKESGKYPGLALGIGSKLLAVLGLVDNINFKKL